MQIHQLNIQYQADQDRVLARINTSAGTELRLWLTRRLTLGLLPLLRKVENEQLEKSLAAQPEADLGMTAKDPKVREMLSEFKKERSLQQADFKTPYKEPEKACLPSCRCWSLKYRLRRWPISARGLNCSPPWPTRRRSAKSRWSWTKK